MTVENNKQGRANSNRYRNNKDATALIKVSITHTNKKE